MLQSCIELVHDRYTRATAAHGELDVSEEAFKQCLCRVAQRYLGPQAEPSSLADFVASLNTTDLFLAFACALGRDDAWKRFFEVYRKYLNDLCRHLMSPGADYEEVSAGISADLFLPDRSGHSRIGSYDGRSSLATWLRVVVSNRVINERSRKGSKSANLDLIPEPPDPRALHDLEGRLPWKDLEVMLSCLPTAISKLPMHERRLVLLRYDRGLQLGEIGRLFSVHQSTITRQIDRAMKVLRCELINLLAEKNQWDEARIHECLQVACEVLSASAMVLTFFRDSVEKDQQTASLPAAASSR